MPKPTVSDVRQHALKLAEDLDKSKGTQLTEGMPDAATLASMVPSWTQQTQPLDEETGKPISATQAVAVPDGEAGGSVDALAGAKEEIDGGEKARNERGQFVSEAAEDIASGSPGVAEPVSVDSAVQAGAPEEPQAQASKAVEAAAEAVLDQPDPWAGYEEVEYEDADLDRKFKVRVPKDDVNAVRGAYQRRADYTRKTMNLGAVRKDLGPLIDDGRIAQVMPLIQLALTNPEYGNFVVEAANRLRQGLPLTPAQVQAVQAATTPQTANTEIPALTEGEDPFMAQVLKPYNEKVDGVITLVQQMAEAERQRAAVENQAQVEYNRRVQIGNAAYAALTQRFPDSFSGDPNKDANEFMRAVNYARESGLENHYGENPSTYVLAYEDLRRSREEAASSPAAAAIAAANQKQEETAIARRNAAAVGGGATKAEPPKKVTPQAPATRVNGVPVDAKEYARQQIARIQAQR